MYLQLTSFLFLCLYHAHGEIDVQFQAPYTAYLDGGLGQVELSRKLATSRS